MWLNHSRRRRNLHSLANFYKFFKKIRNFKHILFHILAWNHHLKYCKGCWCAPKVCLSYGSSIPLASSRESKERIFNCASFLFQCKYSFDSSIVTRQYLNKYYATTSEKFYSCVLKETITILQQAKALKESKKLLSYLDRGQANFRGPGRFEAKDLTLEAKDFKNCPRRRPRGQRRPRARHLWLPVLQYYHCVLLQHPTIYRSYWKIGY